MTLVPSSPVPAAMAVTVGVDIVDVPRVERLLRRAGAAESLLTAGELAYCRSRPPAAQHVAARFAAKEAVLKAFGTGLGDGLRWTDVEILNDGAGRPRVHLHHEAGALAARRGLAAIDISLSHTADLAIAHAVAVWSPADRNDNGEDDR